MFKNLDLFNDSFFNDFFGDSIIHKNNYKMRSDVYETNENYVLEVELPGYKKEMVKVSIEDEYLIVTASISDEDYKNNYKGKNFILRERNVDNINRMYHIGKGYNLDNIAAKYENGVLTIKLPKIMKNGKKTIEIF